MGYHIENNLLFLVLVIMFSLNGCTRINTNTKGSDVNVVPVEAIPMEVSVKVGEKISGDCSFKSIFGIPLEAPEKRAFGVEFDQAFANFGGICTEGAVHDAVSKVNADVMIAPRYTVSGFTLFCLPFTDACIWKSKDVNVSGYKGTYENFEKLSPDMRRSRAMIRAQLENEKIGKTGRNKIESDVWQPLFSH